MKHVAPVLPDAAGEDFESLLSDLSAAFVRVSVEEIDCEIDRWLERIVLAMGVDRSTIAQVDPTDESLYVSHQWARPGFNTPIRGLRAADARRLFPWLLEKVLAGEPVVISQIDDIPREATRDRDYFLQNGNKSQVTIPLKVGGTVVGAVSFGAIRFGKKWSEQEVQRPQIGR